MKNIYLVFTITLLLCFQTVQGQVWSDLGMGPGVGGGSGSTTVPGVYDDNIVAGGDYSPYIVEWNGTSWAALGGGFLNYSYVSAIVEYKNILYISGDLDSAKGLSGNHPLVTWNGTAWAPVNVNGTVSALFVFDSMLYVGGNFDTIGGVPAINIARWNGTNWSAVGGGSNSSFNSVSAISEYNGQLVAAGTFNSIGGVQANNIALWNGSSWSALGNGRPGTIRTIVTNDSILYVAGDTSGDNYVFYMASWNGTSWADMGITVQVFSLASYNGNLFAGGIFDSIAGIPANNIAQFNGTKWYGVGGGIDSGQNIPFTYVGDMLAYNNNLYVGGIFEFAGDLPVNNLAIWGAPISGINPVADNNKFIVYPNPGNGMLNIAMQNITEPCQVDVYNLLGEKIYHAYLNSANTCINMGKQASGVYLYRISKEDDTLVSSGRYILE